MWRYLNIFKSSCLSSVWAVFFYNSVQFFRFDAVLLWTPDTDIQCKILDLWFIDVLHTTRVFSFRPIIIGTLVTAPALADLRAVMVFASYSLNHPSLHSRFLDPVDGPEHVRKLQLKQDHKHKNKQQLVVKIKKIKIHLTFIQNLQ